MKKQSSEGKILELRIIFVLKKRSASDRHATFEEISVKVARVVDNIKAINRLLRRVYRGPSIYDVHTEGEGSQDQVDACGRGRGIQPHVDVHTENLN